MWDTALAIIALRDAGMAADNSALVRAADWLLDEEITVDEGKAEMKALDARRKELQAQLENADEPPPLLHPEMAELYRQKVTRLAQALEHPETRTEATEALRGLSMPSS